MLQALNSSMIAVAVVGIAAHYGSGAGISWVISALYIATAVTAPTAGKLGVLLGPRRVYLSGLALIAAGSILGALAPSLTWLIVARVILGIGTASQYPTAMTIVRAIAERRGAQTHSAIAILTVCSQSMVALGPTVGGVLVGVFGWQSIMWVNIPMVVLTAVWVLRTVPRDRPRDETAVRARAGFVHSMDPVGMALFVGVVTSVMFLLLSLTGAPLWWLVPVVVATAVVFVAWEMHADEPFIDVRTIAGNPALGLTLARTLVTYTAFYCIFFGLPQWLQVSRGFSAGTAGLLMLPVAGIGIVSTILASRLFAVSGARPTLAVGTAGLLLGGVLLAVVERDSTPVLVLLLVACVLGVPNGFNNMGNQNLINAVTSVREVGTALGLYRMIQYIGANLAAVVIELATHHTGFTDGGLHRIGVFIAVVGAVLLVGVALSKTLRGQPARAGQPTAGTAVAGSSSVAADNAGTVASSANGKLSGLANPSAAGTSVPNSPR
ncbi:MFS transporter [Rhodococcus sp. HNM0569]|uniref:MFS transporter n=1 Tax=Rhodococcus sp. HNM0569 TaxID=2716340 RepID=UPI00146F9321|nr:MFS transporter [Rhodococcus sp. HNM0569]NLU82321.1 MFS transporter [Rhodococcus sp. HNM0569]